MSCSWMGTSTWSRDGRLVTVSLASPAFSSSQPGWGRPVWSWIDSCTFRFWRMRSLTWTTSPGVTREEGLLTLPALDGPVPVRDQLACLVTAAGQPAAVDHVVQPRLQQLEQRLA